MTSNHHDVAPYDYALEEDGDYSLYELDHPQSELPFEAEDAEVEVDDLTSQDSLEIGTMSNANNQSALDAPTLTTASEFQFPFRPINLDEGDVDERNTVLKSGTHDEVNEKAERAKRWREDHSHTYGTKPNDDTKVVNNDEDTPVEVQPASLVTRQRSNARKAAEIRERAKNENKEHRKKLRTLFLGVAAGVQAVRYATLVGLDIYREQKANMHAHAHNTEAYYNSPSWAMTPTWAAATALAATIGAGLWHRSQREDRNAVREYDSKTLALLEANIDTAASGDVDSQPAFQAWERPEGEGETLDQRLERARNAKSSPEEAQDSPQPNDSTKPQSDAVEEAQESGHTKPEVIPEHDNSVLDTKSASTNTAPSEKTALKPPDVDLSFLDELLKQS